METKIHAERESAAMCCGIYTITSPSGKQYVGSAVNFKRRWAGHLSDLRGGRHRNRKLQFAFKKYGDQGLVFARLLVCSKADLLIYEQRAIDILRPAYNLAMYAAAPMQGLRHSASTLKRLSEVKSGANHPHFGKSLTEAHRAALSQAIKGDKCYWFGRTISIEARTSISNSLKGRFCGEDNPSAKAVVCVGTGRRFVTGQAALDWLKTNGHPKAQRSAISSACSGNRHSAYGYRWKFADEINDT